MSTPVIGVVIPAHNVGPWITRALESLLDQSHKAWRAVVVDDGSSDETAYRLAQLERGRKWLALDRLTVIRQAHAGLPDAVNAGVAALGDVAAVTCLGGDDMMSRTYLAQLWQALERNRLAPCAYGRVCDFSADLNASTGFWFAGPWCPDRLKEKNCIPGCAVWRKTVWDRVGGFDPSYTHGCEDWAFAAKAEVMGLLTLTTRPAEVPGAMYYHRVRAGSLTQTMDPKYLATVRARIAGMFPTHEPRIAVAGRPMLIATSEG